MNNVICPDMDPYSWRELVDRKIEQLSAIGKAGRIVVRLPNTPELAATMIAGFETGHVMVPLDPSIGQDRYSFIMRHCEASAEITSSGVTVVHNVEAAPSHEDDRLMIYTSGTTGDPKGVVLTKANIVANAEAVAALHDFRNKTHATCLPMWHVNALCMSLFGTYLANGTMILCEKYNPERYFKVCDEHGVCTASLVPALIRRLLEVRPKWPTSLEYIITAAAPLSQIMAKEFFSFYGPRLRQGYGLSEATNFSFLSPLFSEEDFARNYVEGYPPVGIPLEGTEYRIFDGEVEVKGRNVMRGYWKNSSATQAAFNGGWLRTGDLGTVRDGLLVLTGRKKEIFLRGGESIAPVEVEEEFRWKGMTGEFVVVGINSDDLGQVSGIIAPELDHKKTRAIAEQLPIKFRPHMFERERLQTTSTGKPQRRLMASGLSSYSIDRAEYADKSSLLRTKSDVTLKEAIRSGVWSSFAKTQSSIHKARFAELPIVRLNMIDAPNLPNGSQATCVIVNHIFGISSDAKNVLVALLSQLAPGSVLVFSEEFHGTDDSGPGILAQWLADKNESDKSIRSVVAADVVVVLEALGINRWGYIVSRHEKEELGATFWAQR